MSALMERYMYGQSDGMFLHGDEKAQILDEMRADGPDRHNRIMRLARRQVEVQRVAAREIAKSGLEGAKTIAEAVVQQTDAMASAIDQAAGRISREKNASPRERLEALAGLEVAFCLDLSEIKWQLAQQIDPLDPLLEGLRQHRSPDAQHLLQQGIAHFAHGHLAKAVESLRSALEYDDRDYQVLVNLGHHAIHKGDAKAARSFFDTVLGLTNRLDDNAQGQVLWAMSRLSYAQADYAQACLFARRAYGKSQEVRHLFLAACYAALAGRWDEARDGLERAIRMDVGCFVRATVEPVLAPVRKKGMGLLSALMQQHLQAFSAALRDFKREISRTHSLVRHPLSKEVLQRLGQEAIHWETTSAYVDVIQRLTAMPACQTVLERIKQYDGWLSEEATTPDNVESLPVRLLRQTSLEGTLLELRRLKEGMRCPLTGMSLVWVPGGAFQMGDGSGQGKGHEGPVHEVRLAGFWLGKYPVTQGEWKQVMGSNQSHFKRGDRYPVECVSWEDVQELIEALNKRGRGTYRLPTEAEWEYACRSGGKEETCSGGNTVDAVAWYGENSGGQTHPVGQKGANGLGLHDMSGLVWEWVADWYDATYYAHSPRYHPTGPAVGSNRVKRGGGYDSTPDALRATFRYDSSPGGWYDDLGFRLVREES